MQPRALVQRIERERRLPAGAGERFTGYGLVGLAFASGHVLAFRRFAASSIGPPFTTIWLRDPQQRWVFLTNVDPRRSCPRYFGPALHAARADEIELDWSGGDSLWIRARDARLQLALRLDTTATTRLLGAAARLAPPLLWSSPVFGTLAGHAAQLCLRAGRITLHGTAPSGHVYHVRPLALWRVRAAAAVLDGRDLGAAVTLSRPLSIGDFSIPMHGLLMAGSASFRDARAQPWRRTGWKRRAQVM